MQEREFYLLCLSMQQSLWMKTQQEEGSGQNNYHCWQLFFVF